MSEMTALAVPTESRTSGPRAVALRDLSEVDRFAELIYRSTLVPKEYRNNKADVIGVIMFGLEVGLNPMQALQNIAWVNGKPSVYGDMQLGIVEASGLLEAFDERSPEDALAQGAGRCTVKRRGRTAITRTFSKADAETAKLWTKDIWRLYPGRMLQMRTRSWALRDAFSDVLKGLMAREEAQDIIDITASENAAVLPSTSEGSPDAEARREILGDIKALVQKHKPSTLEGAYRTFIPEEGVAAVRAIFGIEKWAELKGQPLTVLQEGYLALRHQWEPDAATEETAQHDDDDFLEETHPRSTQGETFESTEYSTSPDNDALNQEADRALQDENSAARTNSLSGAGSYATSFQIEQLKKLAQRVGDDAYANVCDLLDQHAEGLTIDVYQIVVGRLQARVPRQALQMAEDGVHVAEVELGKLITIASQQKQQKLMREHGIQPKAHVLVEDYWRAADALMEAIDAKA